MNCNRRATNLIKNTGGQHRDIFTYLTQQRMACPSILSALQSKINMVRHPCTPFHIFASLINWVACSIKTNQEKRSPYASDKGVSWPIFAATLHQVGNSSELTKPAEPGLLGREMANVQQLSGATEFSSGYRSATLPLWAKAMTVCKAPELS